MRPPQMTVRSKKRSGLRPLLKDKGKQRAANKQSPEDKAQLLCSQQRLMLSRAEPMSQLPWPFLSFSHWYRKGSTVEFPKPITGFSVTLRNSDSEMQTE